MGHLAVIFTPAMKTKQEAVSDAYCKYSIEQFWHSTLSANYIVLMELFLNHRKTKTSPQTCA